MRSNSDNTYDFTQFVDTVYLFQFMAKIKCRWPFYSAHCNNGLIIHCMLALNDIWYAISYGQYLLKQQESLQFHVSLINFHQMPFKAAGDVAYNSFATNMCS